MRVENKIVPLSSIDLSDHTFRITTERAIDELAESMKLLGLINPPLLIESGLKFIVASGFRRLRAGIHLGWPAVTVKVAAADTDKLEIVRYAVSDNALQRPLNLIEQSRALNLLAENSSDPLERVHMAAALALPRNPDIVGKIQNLCRLPPFVQELIVAGVISLSMAVDLHKIPTAECLAFAKIFNELRLSLSKQREVFSLVREIALREEKNNMAILTEPDLCRMLSDENLSRAQKTSELRFYLKQRRFPALVEARRKFEEFKHKLSLRNNFYLIPPSDFEGSEYIIRFHFSSTDELKSHHAMLDRLIENNFFNEMLD